MFALRVSDEPMLCFELTLGVLLARNVNVGVALWCASHDVAVQELQCALLH